MKKWIASILACEPEKLKATFLRQYLPVISDFAYGAGTAVSDEKLGAMTLRAESELDFLLLMDLPDDPGIKRVGKEGKEYVLAAVEDQEGVHAALYERKAYLAGNRKTKLSFPAEPDRVWRILERCRLADDELTTSRLNEVLSDTVWAILRERLLQS